MISTAELVDGEHVVLATRRHLKSMFGVALLFVVVCAATGFLVAVVPAGASQRMAQLIVGAVGMIVLSRWALWPLLSWRAATYVVTNERIINRHGVIRQHGRTVPLSQVNDVACYRGVLDRVVGCGTLVVTSGGELDPLVLRDVPSVTRAQRTIYTLVESEHDRETTGFVADEPHPV